MTTIFQKSFLFVFAIFFAQLHSSLAYCEPLKVGLVLPLSGPLSDFGVAVQNALKLVESEKINPERIVFETQDSRYDPQISISAFRKLSLNNNSDLVYVWGTTPSVVVAPVANKIKLPLITMNGEPSAVGTYPYVIDFVNRLDDQSKLLLDYLRAKGHKKIGILKTEIQFIESLVKGMEKNLRPDESIVIIDSFPPVTTIDLNSTIIKIKKLLFRSEFDIVGVFLMTGQLSSFYQKMKLFDVKVPTFGSDFLGQKDEMLSAGDSAIGAVYPAQYVSPIFTEKYEKRFHNTNQISHAAIAYDFFNLLYDKIEPDHDKLSGIELLNKFENVGVNNGAGGSFYFVTEESEDKKVKSKRFVFPLILKEVINDGKSEEIKFPSLNPPKESFNGSIS